MKIPLLYKLYRKLSHWFFRCLAQQFGPLLMKVKNKQLEDDLESIRLILINLAEIVPGQSWIESTEAAIFTMSEVIADLKLKVAEQQKIINDIKNAEDLWRGGKAFTKYH